MGIKGKFTLDAKGRALLVKARRLADGRTELVKSSVKEVLQDFPAGDGYRRLRCYLERRIHEQIRQRRI